MQHQADTTEVEAVNERLLGRAIGMIGGAVAGALCFLLAPRMQAVGGQWLFIAIGVGCIGGALWAWWRAQPHIAKLREIANGES